MKIIIFIIILIGVDQITGRIFNHLYFRQVAGEYYRATYTIDSTKADILAFGSSRACYHYDPDIFEEKLNMSFYNSGRVGNYLLYNYATFMAVTKRYSPKLIIFDINPDELIYHKSDYEGLATLLPYYIGHPEMRDIIELRSSAERFKLYSASYPFNSLLINILVGNLKLSERRQSYRKGYLPSYKKMVTSLANNNLKETSGKIDEYKVDVINNIVSVCKIKNIRLLIVCSPIFNNSKESPSYRIIKEIVKNEHMHYLNFSNDSIFDNHPEYFQDNLHLNDDGAKVYSKIISNDIYKFDFLEQNNL